MEQETMASSSVEEGGRFDPKKLGRLTLARRAMSMESELTRSSRWNLPSSPKVQRAISLDGQKPATSSLDISSLRSLGSSPSKRGAQKPVADEGAQDSATHDGATTFRGAALVDETSHPGRPKEEKKHSFESLIAACKTQHAQQASREVGTSDNARGRDSTKQRTKRSTSICSGVGDSAIAALSELGRRRSIEAPAILLPSNKPFLVGEHANRLHQQSVPGLSLRPRHQHAENGPINLSKCTSKDATANTTRKEASNITLLSKLLFFGGTTPQKEQAAANESTPEAVLLSPDVTTVSQSDSCNDLKNSYLLQLGQIMGEVSIEPRRPLHPRPQELDETSSSVSSLDYYSSAPLPAHEDFSTRQVSGFRRILFLVTFVMMAFVAARESECVYVAYHHAKQLPESVVPLACDSYQAALHRVENFTTETKLMIMEQWNVQKNKTIDWVDGYVGTKEALVRFQRARQLTVRAYSIAMAFILDPTPLPEDTDILRPANQYTPVESFVEALGTLPAAVVTPKQSDGAPAADMQTGNEPTVQSLASTESPREDTSLNDSPKRDIANNAAERDGDVLTPATTDTTGALVSTITVFPGGSESFNDSSLESQNDNSDSIGDDVVIPSTVGMISEQAVPSAVAVRHESLIALQAEDVSANLAETETESISLDGSGCETDVSGVEGDRIERSKLAEGSVDETNRSGHSAKDRLQAAATEDLQHAMGRRVMTQLATDRKTSFTLSLTAQVGIRKDKDHEDNAVRRPYQLSSIPLSRELIHRDMGRLHQRALFDKSFSCGSTMVTGRSICRVFESTGDEDASEHVEEILSEKDDGDEFLQKPLNEIVGDFFRERRRRRKEAKERKRRKRESA